jgi:CheY-like chemotaxis protein
MGKPGHPPCPDLVLLDINLPKVDGPGVLAEFRKHPAGAHTPVIVVTSSDTARERARMAALGIAGYFRKPPELEVFMMLGGIVRNVVESRSA